MLSSGDLPLLHPTHCASLVGPSNVPEGGHGPRRRQPSAPAALQKNKIAILLIFRGIAIVFVIENYYLVVAN